MMRVGASTPPRRHAIGYNVRVAAKIQVYLEVADKRTFAGAIDWPGWARSGRTADEALATLAAYRDRYAAALHAAHLRPPAGDAELIVSDRLHGGSGTEYGVASVAPPADEEPLNPDDLERHVRFLDAAWGAFDRAVAGAKGVELATGPRGGGRDLAKMAAHLIDAEQAYIGQLGARAPKLPAAPLEALGPLHEAAREALNAKVRGDLPSVGARGGKRWTARYFVRRAAWHALDHAWEIEDRSGQG
jgi:hypothetical protein